MLEKGRLLRDKISLEGDEDDAGGGRMEVKGGRDRNVASSSSSSSEEEEDFMSDAFLAGAESDSGRAKGRKEEETYTERRRREVQQAHERGKTLNRVEREHQARREGLNRSLFGEFDSAGRQENDEIYMSAGSKKRKTDGEQWGGASSAAASSNKALKMMMAMGYEHGRSLGKRDDVEEEDEDDEEDTDAEKEGNHESASMRPRPGKTSKLVEPLPLDERWLGSRVRAGIGQVSTRSAQASLSRDISAASTKEAERQNSRSTAAEDSFRSRSSAEHSIRHWERLLVDARRTCEDLDTEQGVKYSPLWIDPESLTKQASELPEHVAQLIEYALAGLDEDASSPHPDEEARARAQEKKQFCFLPAKVRLDITISHLRRAHNYCLYCGQRYNTAEQLSNECPGEDEDDH